MKVNLMNRRAVLAIALGMGLAPAAFARNRPMAVEVWKDPSCGCCNDWIAHMTDNGFAVRAHETGNDGARSRLGVDPKFGSCHTAQVGGYAIEGHVPAREIKRLLAERPAAIGLAVPGMPVGAPGMDGPAYGGRQDAFDVLLLTRGGGSQVYQPYKGSERNRA